MWLPPSRRSLAPKTPFRPGALPARSRALTMPPRRSARVVPRTQAPQPVPECCLPARAPKPRASMARAPRHVPISARARCCAGDALTSQVTQRQRHVSQRRCERHPADAAVRARRTFSSAHLMAAPRMYHISQVVAHPKGRAFRCRARARVGLRDSCVSCVRVLPCVVHVVRCLLAESHVARCTAGGLSCVVVGCRPWVAVACRSVVRWSMPCRGRRAGLASERRRACVMSCVWGRAVQSRMTWIMGGEVCQCHLM